MWSSVATLSDLLDGLAIAALGDDNRLLLQRASNIVRQSNLGCGCEPPSPHPGVMVLAKPWTSAATLPQPTHFAVIETLPSRQIVAQRAVETCPQGDGA